MVCVLVCAARTYWRYVMAEDYEAPRDTRKKLKVRGVGRVADEPRAMLVCFNERPTDEELRFLHDVMERAVACMYVGHITTKLKTNLHIVE
jgi:hypothetical protein